MITLSSWERHTLNQTFQRVVSSGRYIGGKQVEAFEEEWAEFVGVRFCVSCGSGFDALKVILLALSSSQTVGVTSKTATPTWAAIDSAGKTIIPDGEGDICVAVHLYGEPHCPITDKIIVEDAAQAHGMAGAGLFGVAAAWSFYPTKNLGALGDAGAITTSDEGLAGRARELCSYTTRGGINSRMDTLQAAFLRNKIRWLDNHNSFRYDLATEYHKSIADVPGIVLPYFHPSHVWHQYVIRVPRRRDELRAWLQSQGVGTQVHYPLPPHRVLGFDFNLPDADLWASEVLSLPLGDETIVRATSQAIKEWGAS